MQSILEQKHIAELKEAFQYIDHDGDGIIEEGDLNELLPALGTEYLQHEMFIIPRAGLKDVDAKEMLGGLPGKLNFPLFLTMMADMIKESRELAATLGQAFETLDDDEDGLVDMAVLEEIIPGIAERVHLAVA